MRIRETDIDEQLDRLQNIEGGEVFFCDSGQIATFSTSKTVAKLMRNTETHTRTAHL